MRTLLSTLCTKIAGQRILPKRSIKTPGALYRILSAELEQLRCGQCRCTMPMLFAVERPDAESANWDVEPLGCPCRPCQDLIARVVARNATLYDLQELRAEPANAAAPFGNPSSNPF